MLGRPDSHLGAVTLVLTCTPAPALSLSLPWHTGPYSFYLFGFFLAPLSPHILFFSFIFFRSPPPPLFSFLFFDICCVDAARLLLDQCKWRHGAVFLDGSWRSALTVVCRPSRIEEENNACSGGKTQGSCTILKGITEGSGGGGCGGVWR